MVKTLGKALGVKAKLEFLSPQPGDVPQTWADVEKARRLLGYKANVSFSDGFCCFVKWTIRFVRS